MHIPACTLMPAYVHNTYIHIDVCTGTHQCQMCIHMRTYTQVQGWSYCSVVKHLLAYICDALGSISSTTNKPMGVIM